MFPSLYHHLLISRINKRFALFYYCSWEVFKNSKNGSPCLCNKIADCYSKRILCPPCEAAQFVTAAPALP